MSRPPVRPLAPGWTAFAHRQLDAAARLVWGGTYRNPWPVVALLGVVTALFLLGLPYLSVNAMLDDMLRENDESLPYYVETRRLLTSDEWAIVAVTPTDPDQDWFTPDGVEYLQHLTSRFGAVPGVAFDASGEPIVRSLLDVPLYESVPVPETIDGREALLRNPPTIDDPRVDLELARAELTTHPVATQNVISSDGRMATLLVPVNIDDRVYDANLRRFQLRQQIEEAKQAGNDAEAESLRTAYAETKEVYVGGF